MMIYIARNFRYQPTGLINERSCAYTRQGKIEGRVSLQRMLHHNGRVPQYPDFASRNRSFVSGLFSPGLTVSGGQVPKKNSILLLKESTITTTSTTAVSPHNSLMHHILFISRNHYLWGLGHDSVRIIIEIGSAGGEECWYRPKVCPSIHQRESVIHRSYSSVPEPPHQD